jgi:hypothetical protein
MRAAQAPVAHRTGTGPGERRYGWWWRTASILALVALVVLALTPAAGAVPTPPGPDLVVLRIETTPLATPFFIEESDGSIQNTTVDVTVFNRGDRDMPPTKLLVRLVQGPAHRVVGKTTVNVRGVLVGRARKVTARIDRFVAPKAISLDPIQIVAIANRTRVDEQLFDNDSRTSPKIPVIARQWNVSQFSAHTVMSTFAYGGVGMLDIKDQTGPGFFWRYDHFDHANRIFVYAAHGGINETGTLMSQICFGTGSGTASHPTWSFPDTDFVIDYGETHYEGTLFARNETPFKIPLQCTTGTPQPIMQPWIDITTFKSSFGPVSTPVGAKTLQDNGTQANSIMYGWRFTADVP